MNDYKAGTKQRADVQMNPAEIEEFLLRKQSITFSSIGPDGLIHTVAMWYGLVDGQVGFVSKRKAQKVVNLGRDSRLSCLVESGETYSSLRGVALIGHARLSEDPVTVEAVARSIFERYGGGPGTKFDAEASTRNRVAVFCEPKRIVSWDHSKLTALPDRLARAHLDQEVTEDDV